MFFDKLSKIEVGINHFFDQFSNPIFDFIAIFTHYLGAKGAIFILIAILLIVSKKYRPIGIVVFFSIGTTAFLTEVLKQIVQRARPFIYDPSLLPLVVEDGYKSFPSGHVAATAAFCFVIIHYFPKLKWYGYGTITIMALSRLYLNVHFLSDVLTSILLAALISYFYTWFADKYLFKNKDKTNKT